MDKLKLTYNKVLKRYHKAVEWLDDPARTEGEIQEKHLVEFRKILGQLNRLIGEAENKGYTMTGREIIEGFSL
jgi:hypothetical protein